MKKIAWGLICAAALVMVGGMPAMAEPLSFGQVVDGLDIKNQTKSNANGNWRKYKRQEVSWSGTVHEVDGRRDEAKVYIADKSRPLYDGFNIYFVTKDTDNANKLKRGQVVHVKGTIDDYHWHGDTVVVKLRDAQLQ